LAKKRKQEIHQPVMTHRQLSRHKKQLRRQRLFLYCSIAIIVAIVGIILGGWIAGEYMPLHRTVLQVYDTKFDTSFLIDSLVVFGAYQSSTDWSSIASMAMYQIQQDELIRQAAAKLGITVSDEEATQFLEQNGLMINTATLELARGTLLSTKVKNDYFSTLVPKTDLQMLVHALMVESESVALLVREKMVNGENFTEIVKQYAADSASKQNNGDYGMHPMSILKEKFYSDVVLEYLSREDLKTGDISQPLSDNTAYKLLGYWLIRVNERPTEDSANVSALFLRNEEEAFSVRAMLEAGGDLAAIAANYTQYSTGGQNNGEFGLLMATDNITNVFNGYVFDPSTEIGVWSQPLKEETLTTAGGYWLVNIVERDENAELSSEDRGSLIDKQYSDWITQITNESVPYVINSLDADLQQWAIKKATEQIPSG
jgi:peptidyl-prolyl cis-trans isomerase SurA